MKQATPIRTTRNSVAILLLLASMLFVVSVLSAQTVDPSNHQILYDGAEVDFPAPGQVTLYYTIIDDGPSGDNAISHTTFDLDLNDPLDGGCLNVIEASTGTWDGSKPIDQNTCSPASISVGAEPTTIGFNNAGLKFEDGYADGEVRYVCYTVESKDPTTSAVTVGSVDFWVKYGPNTASVTVPGATCSAPGAIGDTVWIDANENKIVDDGEAGIPNVTLKLIDNDTNVTLATTTTDENGLYLFSGLPAGNYRVDVLDSELFSIGYYRTTDFDPIIVVLGSGEVFLDADFGYNLVPDNCGLVGDFVWEDIDQEGDFDPGEVPVEGVTVTIDDFVPCSAARTPLPSAPATARTDAYGFYVFGPLQLDNTYQTSVPASFKGEIKPDRIVTTSNPSAAEWNNTIATTQSGAIDDANRINLDLDFAFAPTPTAVTLNASGAAVAHPLTPVFASAALLLLTAVAFVWQRSPTRSSRN